MSLRSCLATLEQTGELQTVQQEVDPTLEMARVISALDERPVLFPWVKGSRFAVVAGFNARREHVGQCLGVPRQQLIAAMRSALQHPVPPPMVTSAPCQEVVEDQVNLFDLPVLLHLPMDGGHYISAGVVIVRDRDLGRNMSFHRLLRLDERRLGARLVEGRGTHAALAKAGGKLELAICIGNSPAVLLAAATSPAPGVDELAIANALQPTPLVKCRTVDLEVPAEAEFVLEGRFTGELVTEGPFLDLTETMDRVRQQPVLEVTCLTHRREAIYQALLPGGLEHKLLMGMPREPTIFDEVSRVCECKDVLLTPGGGAWLHAVVQIHKRGPDDGRLALEAAFRGHGSLKHACVVDDDVDISDPRQVEWAIATRVQADTSIVIWPDQPGSSLDPSAHHEPGVRSRTAKMGVDATIPWRKPDGELRTAKERAQFRRSGYEPVSLDQYRLHW
ncbi:MAG: 3-octaprenyl-4-hydroxybenzoate carboxy-lyase [Chloroflexi bacterium ADurb.Bin180]|nr:MAG: 3-octaprenyl-4-hydroxybenzoate carboxy-lyase [Chloroflexi bacterium ADurb.Bin180]